MIKVLNLYAGTGGNRKLWQDVEVTAVEHDPKIAAIYQDFFPKDKVVVGDAHAYLLENFKLYDFIWSSPPCPTHSEIRRCGVYRGQYKAKYPDMKLYEEIIMLKYFHRKGSKYIIENVKSYYDPLIPCQEVANHYFWANFTIGGFHASSRNIQNTKVSWEKHGFNIKDKECGNRKDQIIRNIFNPHLGLHILNESKRDIQPELFR